MKLKLNNYIKLLEELISFKTVSTTTDSSAEMNKAINWLQGLFTYNKFKTTLFTSKLGNPVLLSYYEVNPKFKTWLVYGHYDVQPAEKQSGWESAPFKLSNKDGKLWGRGAMDNKGQFLIHLISIFDLIKSKKLKYNIKFLIEGNEETGSEALMDIIEKHKRELSCDHILISDGDLVGDNPVIEAGFRGVANATLTYETATNSVHSGEFANAIPNAAQELSKLISSIFGPEDNILIPDFNKGIKSTRLIEIPLDFAAVKTRLGNKTFFINTDKNFHETVGQRPSISVTGFKSGYIEEGYANIIPNTAEARFNLRFGQDQDPDLLMKLFAAHIVSNTPEYVTAKLNFSNYVKAESLNLEDPELKKIAKLLENIYQDNVVYKFVGGTLPIIGKFKTALGVEPFSIPLANEDSNMHGANENISIANIEKGLIFSTKLFSESF